MAAIYAVWMLAFIRWDTYATANTLLTKDMYANKAVYYIWVAVSVIIFLLYPVFVNKIYYADKLTKANKIFNIITLFSGLIFITVYGFLMDPIKYTASMMGLYFPWLFKLWCVLSGISVFTNVLYMYRKNEYRNDVGVILTSIGCAALYVTVNIPSAGEELIMTLQCLAHWSTALIFALLGAAGVVIFLVSRCRLKDKKYIALTVFFVAVLLLMLVLLVVVGKSAAIENIPMWAAYLVLFLVNFTNIFDKKEVKA